MYGLFIQKIYYVSIVTRLFKFFEINDLEIRCRMITTVVRP